MPELPLDLPDLDIPALQALLTGPLSDLPVGSVVETDPVDDQLADGVWLAFGGRDCGYWWDIIHSDEDDGPSPSDHLSKLGARLTRVSVDVATLAALLDAAEERDRLRTFLALPGAGESNGEPRGETFRSYAWAAEKFRQRDPRHQLTEWAANFDVLAQQLRRAGDGIDRLRAELANPPAAPDEIVEEAGEKYALSGPGDGYDGAGITDALETYRAWIAERVEVPGRG
jgi:hypothetical protein